MPTSPTTPTARDRADRCPGALRPWPADDGLLVRLRLVGGRLTARSLRALLAVAERYGDGRIHLTSRANLQLRGLPCDHGALAPDALTAIEATGLLPSRSHELVRNVMVSPQTGLAGGRADLRPVAGALDAALVAEPRLAALPGRFLFVLDDGRGDLVERPGDLGVAALTDGFGQLRVGDAWGPVVPLPQAAARLARLALDFLATRGVGASAAWHVRELPTALVPPADPDPRLPRPVGALPYGDVPGGRHVAAPGGVLTPDLVRRLVGEGPADLDLIVTPWRGVLVPTIREDA